MIRFERGIEMWYLLCDWLTLRGRSSHSKRSIGRGDSIVPGGLNGCRRYLRCGRTFTLNIEDDRKVEVAESSRDAAQQP